MTRFNPVSIASHFRDAGATPAEEMAYTLSDGKAYVRACLARGMDIDLFAPRLSWFFYTYTNFFEEVAKYRAGRRIWSRMMKEFGRSPSRRYPRVACAAGIRCRATLNNIAPHDRDDGGRWQVSVHARRPTTRPSRPDGAGGQDEPPDQQIVNYETGVPKTSIRSAALVHRA
jgi:hypothetical protein